jgi:hypothetical protein
MNKKTREAVRTIGYLLETNGTTRAFARSKTGKSVDSTAPSACKFCLIGAIEAVTDVLNLSFYETRDEIGRILGLEPNRSMIPIWDDATKFGHNQIVENLKNA